MFRSTLATLAAGSGAGVFVGTVSDSGELKSAAAGFCAALLVAGTDWLARKHAERKHEQKFLAEHRKTRALVTGAARRRKRRLNKGKQS